MNMNVSFKIVVTILLFTAALTIKSFAGQRTIVNGKGLFIIQFSWDPDSFSRNYQVSINYRKVSKLAMMASPKQASASKNITLELELPGGSYEIVSIDFYSPELNGRKLTIPTTLAFNVTPGYVTNGGVMFLIKDPKANNVMLLPVENEREAREYCSIHQKGYASAEFVPAWKFTDNEKLTNLKKSYAKLIVAREQAKPRKSVSYVYGVLGLFLKLEKTPDGTVTGFQSIETNTFQEILNATITGKNILLDLGQGHYLYGSDDGFATLELPADIESQPHIHLVGPDKLLAYDENINIYSSSGSGASWKKQDDYRVESVAINPQFNIPQISLGPDKIYLFTTGPNKFKRLWQSGYDDIHFTLIELPEEIKRIPQVSATANKLVIGPIPSGAIKNQAAIYVKENSSNTWQLVLAPRGDCDVLYIDPDNDSKYAISCGLTKDRLFLSTDSGKTWTEVDRNR